MNLDVKSWLQENRGKATLLGICPMSEEIIRAALKEAAEFCRCEPPSASVSGVGVEWGEPTGEFSGFEVRYMS